MKEYKYTIDGNKYNVAINEVNDTTAKVTVNGNEYTVEWEKPAEEKPIVKVQPAVAKPVAAPAAAAAPTAAPVSGNAIKTPLPGVIIDVKVKVGDTVKKGDTVKRGDKIATVGKTGRVSIPQLHFEIRKNGSQINPQRYVYR